MWRIKSKNQPVSLVGLDVNGDGQMELLVGWSNGKMDVRNAHSGDVLWRENFKHSVAGIMVTDYNMDGQEEVVVCLVSGEVIGYKIGTLADQDQVINSHFEQV